MPHRIDCDFFNRQHLWVYEVFIVLIQLFYQHFVWQRKRNNERTRMQYAITTIAAIIHDNNEWKIKVQTNIKHRIFNGNSIHFVFMHALKEKKKEMAFYFPLWRRRVAEIKGAPYTVQVVRVFVLLLRRWVCGCVCVEFEPAKMDWWIILFRFRHLCSHSFILSHSCRHYRIEAFPHTHYIQTYTYIKVDFIYFLSFSATTKKGSICCAPKTRYKNKIGQKQKPKTEIETAKNAIPSATDEWAPALVFMGFCVVAEIRRRQRSDAERFTFADRIFYCLTLFFIKRWNDCFCVCAPAHSVDWIWWDLCTIRKGMFTRIPIIYLCSRWFGATYEMFFFRLPLSHSSCAFRWTQ